MNSFGLVTLLLALLFPAWAYGASTRDIWHYGEARAGVHVSAIEPLGERARVVAGDFTTLRLPMAGVTLDRLGKGDGYLVWIDHDERARWALRFAGEGASASVGQMVLDRSGNVIAAIGVHDGDLSEPFALRRSGSSTAAIAKFDAHGRLLWVNRLGVETGGVFMADLIVGMDGEVTAAAIFHGELLEPPVASRGVGTRLLVRFDAQGSLLWTHADGVREADPDVETYPVTVKLGLDSSGMVHAATIWRSHSYACEPRPIVCLLRPEVALETFDRYGERIESQRLQRIGPSEWIENAMIAVDGADNLILATQGDVSVVTQLDPEGRMKWMREFPSDSSRGRVDLVDIDIGQGDRIFLVGRKTGAVPTEPFLATPAQGPLLLELDRNGNVLSGRTWRSETAWGGLRVAATDGAAPYVFGSLSDAWMDPPAITRIGYYDGLVLGPEAVLTLMQSGFE